ncbi:MAG: hypothetical protein SGI77_06835 [Pirellulaceae bacterium]|nr:hypothetical protein [Pirellulaceae bacterium]
MAKRAFVTVVTRNYTAYAKVVMDSVGLFHPEDDRWVCFADELPTSWNHGFDWATPILGSELGIENWDRYSFQYTPFELACALKPHAMEYLADQGYEEIIYIDSDMQLFGRLSEAFDALEDYSIVLTPHLTLPLPLDGKRPDETAFLNSGAYNAGFVGIRSDSEGRRFLRWWKTMLRKHCIVDIAGSLFVDQKWLDLVPGLFQSVFLLRHPGYNAGHWSLSQFSISEVPLSDASQSRVAMDGKPLILFHFSGLTPDKPCDYLKHQTRTHLDDAPSLKCLVANYHRALAESSLAECMALGTAWDMLDDRTPIRPAWREAIRRDHRKLCHIDKPYESLLYPGLVDLWRSIESDSVHWRRDWEIQVAESKGLHGHLRRTNETLKKLIKRFRPRNNAA